MTIPEPNKADLSRSDVTRYIQRATPFAAASKPANSRRCPPFPITCTTSLRRRRAAVGFAVVTSPGQDAFLIAEVFIDAAFAALIPPEALRTTTQCALPPICRATWQKPSKANDRDGRFGHGHFARYRTERAGFLVDRSAANEANTLILFSNAIYRGDLVHMDIRLK